MGMVETVKIVAKNKEGYIVINKGDFTNRNELFKEIEKKPEEEIPEEKEPEPPKRKREVKKNVEK